MSSGEPPAGFTWDAAKAESNFTKHGVAFGEATTVFEDPLADVRIDDLHSWDEDRMLVTGRSAAGRLLTVSYTVRGDETRIISAWPATPGDRRDYEQSANR